VDTNKMEPSGDSSEIVSSQQWRGALITKEDPLHVHKTLGILCLFSFLWRFGQIGETTDMGFASHPDWTLPTLLLHYMLSLSSFEFRIPPKRINSGFRIWAEYRIHSVVFLCRSLALMALTWYEQKYELPPIYWMNLAIVLATVAAADIGSNYYGEKYKSGFARQLQVPNIVKFLFSFAQFQATVGCLYGMRRYSIQFVFCMIVQCNAFLMTLRRKNLAGHYLLVSLYGLLLVGGVYVCHTEVLLAGIQTLRIFLFATTLSFVIRLAPRLPFPFLVIQSKYVLWPCIFLLMQSLRPLVYNEVAILSEQQLLYAGLASVAASMVLCFYKCSYGYGNDESVVEVSLKSQ
jgi:hypothetical protein